MSGVRDFRINAKSFSLTFPQCDASKEELLHHLQQMQPVYVGVCREAHESGAPHLHAAVFFKKKKNIKDAKHFDFNGFHCNIQATKRESLWVKYLKKDGDFIESGTIPAQYSSRCTSQNPNPITLSSVSSEELFDYCVTNHVGYGYYNEEKRRRSTVSYDILEDTELHGTMDLILHATSMPEKTVVLIGRSGAGKSTWAKKNIPKPALFVTHLDKLKEFKTNYHKGIIFDDMDFNHHPLTSQIHLVDQDDPRAIHVRYGTVDVPARVPKIFTCNVRPFADCEMINRRIKLIKID